MKKSILIFILTLVAGATLSIAAETFKWNNVKIGGGGGYVPAVIYSETEKDLVFARTDMGGLYRQDKTTKKWKPLTDWVNLEQWNLLGAESFAIDPVKPNIVYLAAGTYTNDWTDMNGYLLRSTDYGDNWTGYQMPMKLGGNMPGRNMGERLAVDPNKPEILFFGARSGHGLWKSINSGETWTKVTSFPVTGDFIQDPEYAYTADPIGVAWVAFDKTSSKEGAATKRIFVGAAQSSGPTVFVSEDGGATWTAVVGQPETSTRKYSENSVAKTETVHLMPNHGLIRNGNLYIPYSNLMGPYEGSWGEVWKYSISSKAWTDISPHNHLLDEAYNPTVAGAGDCYFGYGGITVDAQNPDVIMTSTLNSWWPDGQLFRSTDGGATWTKSFYWDQSGKGAFKYKMELTFPWLNWGIATDQFPDVVGQKLGWMLGDIQINPFNSDEFMYGTGATIYGTSNLTDWGSTTKVSIKSVADGVEECAVLSLAVPPITTGASADVKLISGVGDIGGFTHTNLQTSTQMFLTPRFGRTSSIDYAELSPNTVWRVGEMSPDRYETKKNLGTSSDGGKTWNTSYQFDSTYKNGSIAVSANGTNVVWAAEGKVPTGGPNHGFTGATNLPAGSYVASDRVNDNKFYAFKDSAFYSGTVTAFTASATKLPASSSPIKAVPGNEGHVWIPCGSKGLWLTEDGGTSFSQIAATSVERADIVGFGMAAKGKSYPAIYITGKVSGALGVFQSVDKGQTWVRLNDDEHQYGSINYAITGDMRRYGVVFVGTNGRGVVYGDTSSNAGNEAGGGGTIGNRIVPSVKPSLDIQATRFLRNALVTGLPVGALLEVFDFSGRRFEVRTVRESRELLVLPNDGRFVIRVHVKGFAPVSKAI